MKNNILKSILLFGSVATLVACTDLEENLVSSITEPFSLEGIDDLGVIRGETTNYGATAAAYDRLRSGTAGNGNIFSIQSTTADDITVPTKGSDWGDGGIHIQLHRHTYEATHGFIKNAWNSQYKSIGECNSALSGGELDADQTAQVRVLRAFYHYRLIDLFGRIRVNNDPNTVAPQSTSAEAFDLIEAELLNVLGITSVTSGMTITTDLSSNHQMYQVNEYAAMGLLAKLYLNAEVYTGTPRYQEAADAADYVINNGGYILADDSYAVPYLGRRAGVDTDPDELTGYAALFAQNNFDNPEMIWAIDFDEVTAGGLQFSMMSLHYASQFAWNLSGQPWNGYSALEEYYNSFDDADLRKTANFIVGPQLDYNGNQIVDLAATDGIELVFTTDYNELEPNASRKAGARFGKFSYKQFQKNDGNNDYPIIRLGDLHLIRGEALARVSGNWTDAANDVNIIRARAGLSALGSVTADAFLAERGKEMFMEVTRRQDLIRFGKYGDAWWEKSASAAYRTVFPIPQDAIISSDGELTQNPGY